MKDQANAKTTGVPIYRDYDWRESFRPDADTVLHAILGQAAQRIIEPTLGHILSEAALELHALLERVVPESGKAGRHLVGMIEDLYPNYINIVVDLAASFAPVVRATFDPMQTMEANFRRALAAIGIADADDATRYALGYIRHIKHYRRFFPAEAWEGVRDDA